MRKVIYWMMVSLDGFIARPNGDLDWVVVDEEIHRFANEQVRGMDALLYGRRMYELMAASWPAVANDPSQPDHMHEFAHIWTPKPKIVFSHTLDKVEWNSRLVRDDLAAEVARLKAEPGGTLGLGGAGIAAAFMRLGLIDEYSLLVNPIVLGSGIPYFPAVDHDISLRLIETRRFESGVVYLHYQDAGRAH